MMVLSSPCESLKNAAISSGVSPRRPSDCIIATPFFGFLLKSATACWYSILLAFSCSISSGVTVDVVALSSSPPPPRCISSRAPPLADADAADAIALALAAASLLSPVPSCTSIHSPSAPSIPLRHSNASAFNTASLAASFPVSSFTPGSPCATRTSALTSRSKRFDASEGRSVRRIVHGSVERGRDQR